MRNWDRGVKWLLGIVFCVASVCQTYYFYPLIFSDEYKDLNWCFKLFYLIGISFGTALVITFGVCLIIFLWIMWIILRAINKNKKSKDEKVG